MSSNSSDRDSTSNSGDAKNNPSFQQALALIARLRKEDFNRITEEKLASHPYLQAAKTDSLTPAQKEAFAVEQYAIQRSDAISFAHLAGHGHFQPKSLASAVVPTDPEVVYPKLYHNNNKDKDCYYPDLFQFLLGGEVYAASLLLDHARLFLGMDGEEDLRRRRRQTSPMAQAYASYWARLALNHQRAAGAAACAVNFPAWGRMCQQLCIAYRNNNNNKLEKEEWDKALAFIQFFATPIDNLDEMAAAIIMQEYNDDDDNAASSANSILSYEEIAEHVRQLQGCELMFWDACYSASGNDGTGVSE